MSPPAIQLEQVSYGTGRQNILQDISLDVKTGDHLGVIGISGSGKTSLLRLLNRLQEPSAGRITVQGQDIRQLPVQSLRQQVLLVPQEPRLLGMTVREALIYPLQLRQLPTQMIQERLAAWGARMGIPEGWLGREELQLSVGQRQWVSIGRALISEPRILLLDEPTAALDVGHSHHLLQVLQQFAGTILLASHQLEFVQQCCDRVVWLHQGRVFQEFRTAGADWQQVRATFQQLELSQDSSAWEEELV